jgi:hypothetical protein
VLPKSVRTVTKANVFAAAREAGLHQIEVVDYSETQAAYKIVRPASKRNRSGSSNSRSVEVSTKGGASATRRSTRRATVKAK